MLLFVMVILFLLEFKRSCYQLTALPLLNLNVSYLVADGTSVIRLSTDLCIDAGAVWHVFGIFYVVVISLCDFFVIGDVK